MFTETLPSGRVRAGYRDRDGVKIQRTFDYAFEAEEWAAAGEKRSAALAVLGLSEADLDAALAASRAAAEVARTAAREEAERARIEAELAGVPEVVEIPTVADYARAWLEIRRGSLAAGTVVNYSRHVDTIAASELGPVRIDRLRRSQVEAWRTGARAAGDGAPTLNARLKVLRAICNYAVSDALIAHDPTGPIRLLSTDDRDVRVLTVAEDDRLLSACRDESERLFVLLGLDAGLRWSEVAGMPASGLVRTDDGRFYVRVAQVVERETRSIRKFTKSGHSRLVPASPRLVKSFRRVALAKRPDELLFATAGRPMDYSAFRHNKWRTITHAAGVNRTVSTGKAGRPAVIRLRFHELRHTFGSRLAAAGVPRHELAQILGHADESTTARYVHTGIDGVRHDLTLDALARIRAAGEAASAGEALAATDTEVEGDLG